jgi:hypothetical protein
VRLVNVLKHFSVFSTLVTFKIFKIFKTTTCFGQFRPKHVVALKILKVTSVENTEKCFKTLTSRTKDGEKK